ncbi:2-polyprenyl-3-methyl-6-methoxy-1,4-benzoquinone monooxygenase [Halieaceae bacterium IMCC14734]|uniref:3-demethoxyubiquinol 3-hydroxylase n=1 Tax=Candidatus Litorirhabdus singularis TaxID=2518993 RepID=A0ABT3TM29_9GAMM|nr:2-polyprenyl-3-methyl-6-methoxy-1,4-benzoquinone monooxygenase [Candidatus Litorirhabdus singularis]MCX2983348.1 2-polyprenyl-3-methyl-6-methoxy-1,4-benzoquinone monooxygenase [Candidatus Litorirhabdus singularis]
MQRRLTPLDRFIERADSVLRTLSDSSNQAMRPSPAQDTEDTELDAGQRQHVAGLMRVNHTGEVCAQALYQGQALTADLPEVRADMEQAASEEIDHLVWCEERLQQLGSHTSLLNPAFYGMSFLMGAAAGLAGDKWSLGFVAATEERVCDHLREHLEKLPEADIKSRQIIVQMLADEERHGSQALEAGGAHLPSPVKQLMTHVAKVMTGASYRL